MRKTYTVLSDPNATMSIYDLSGSAIAVETRSAEGRAIIIINPTSAYGGTYTLPDGEWKLVANINQAGADTIMTKSGSVTVTGNSFMVFVK
jgi:hypothetical protein